MLIHLVANAIQFRALSDTRNIAITVGKPQEPPNGTTIPGLQIVPSKSGVSKIIACQDWGAEEAVDMQPTIEEHSSRVSEEEKQVMMSATSEVARGMTTAAPFRRGGQTNRLTKVVPSHSQLGPPRL
ncbi:hypothetical protein B0T10DRAFT_463718 [Thelonectria olida]|uniref:Uncharacterized protein n=1 Tax=Thelonectria olida TaxID=1576542 RepID=A0A9P9ALB3_9HYPO|nr:hypothetical protein B0T10DRAFT_463718 [Thelonectria olida]